MAKDLNMCQFIGRLGREPEIRYTNNGDAIANFSIACSDDYTKEGQKHEKTEWINIVAYRKLAEIIGEYLHKGSQVYIQGKMQTRKWEKDGITRYSTEVIADQMQMLGSKNDSTDDSGDGSASQNTARPDDQNNGFDDDYDF